MRKSKTCAALLLAALLAVCLGLTACSRNKEPDSVKLAGWTETATVEVDLGDVYTIASADLSVKDEADASYKVTYAVQKNADGSSVTPIANGFKIDSMGGYTITFTAHISDSATQTRTVILRVTDREKPVINIGELPVGIVGQDYVFSIRVTDLSGETIVPKAEVFLVEGNTEKGGALEGNSFRPTVRGSYKLKVTATDSSGNTETAEAEFSVRNAKIANAIDDFDDPTCVVGSTNVLSGITTAQPEWIAEKDGRTGIVTTNSGSGKDEKGNFFFKFPMTEEELLATDFDYVSFWVWVDAEGTHKVYNCNAPLNFSVKGKTWQYITLSRAQIHQDEHADGGNWNNSWYSLGADKDGPRLDDETPFEAFCRLMTGEDGFYFFYISDLTDTTVYVDDILFRYDDELTGFADRPSYAFGDTVTLNARPDGNSAVYSVYDPFGAKVELKNNAFTIDRVGTYAISATVTDGNGIVSSYPNMPIVIPRPAPAAGEIESFDTPSSIDSVSLRNGTAPVYVADKPENSAHGSVSFEIPYDPTIWPRLFLTPRQELSAYAGYNAIEVALKIESELLDEATVYFYKGGGGEVSAQVKTNEWVRVQIPIDKFLAEFDTLNDPAQTDDGGFLWFTANDDNNGNKTKNYIDGLKINGITAVKLPVSDPTKIAEFGHEFFLNNVSTMEPSSIRFVDQAAIDADDTHTLPALDGSMNGYAAITKTNEETWLTYQFKPQCSFETFAAADYMEIRMYISDVDDLDSGEPRTEVPIYYHNTGFATVPVGSWQSVKFPLSVIYHPNNLGIRYNALQNFFEDMSVNQTFSLVGVGQTTVYISSVNLGNDARDASLGDAYTVVDAEHIASGSGTVSEVTLDGKECVKVVSDDAWESIFATPLKTYSELARYSHLKLTVYVQTDEATALFRSFSQYFLGMDGSDYVNETIMYYDNSDESVELEKMGMPTNQWVDLLIPMEWIQKLYYRNDDGFNNNALMIMQNSGFGALYIASITCIA